MIEFILLLILFVLIVQAVESVKQTRLVARILKRINVVIYKEAHGRNLEIAFRTKDDILKARKMSPWETLGSAFRDAQRYFAGGGHD